MLINEHLTKHADKCCLRKTMQDNEQLSHIFLQMLTLICDILIFFLLYIADLLLNCINDAYFILNFEIIKSGIMRQFHWP